MKMFVQTYGCQINEHDSARIVRLMKAQNYTLTERPEEADLVIVNTCSVRDKAEQKVYSLLGRFRELKGERSVILGVGGCVAQQEGEALLGRIPHLDFVFGTHSIGKLPQLVEDVRSLGRRPAAELDFYRDPTFMEDPEGRPYVEGPKAYVPIMQGCNKVCSFCIVPYVRGREVSRLGENIIAEIEDLVHQGVKEVMLLGQNVNSYGESNSGGLTFPDLLHRINGVPGLERIRFTTSHPQDLSAGLIEAYANLEKLCEHLHLPVQSGSDAVLRRMRRGYTRREYLNRIGNLRRRCPEVALSTDIIVGFPGETEQEFQETLEILQEIEYDDLYSFMYSPRPRTLAEKIYRDDISEEVKRERLSKVQKLQGEISLRKNRHRIGTVEEVLVEGRAKVGTGKMSGRARSNRIVNFNGPEELRGKTVGVRITGASANSLMGEWLSGTEFH